MKTEIIHATGQSFQRRPRYINTRASKRQVMKIKQHNNKIGNIWQQYNHKADMRLAGLAGKFRQKGLQLVHLADRKPKRWYAGKLQIRLAILHDQQQGANGTVTERKPGLFDAIRARMARSRELTI